MIYAIITLIAVIAGLIIASVEHHRKQNKYIEDLRGIIRELNNTASGLNLDIEELQRDVETYERLYKEGLQANEVLRNKLKERELLWSSSTKDTCGKRLNNVISTLNNLKKHYYG